MTNLLCIVAGLVLTAVASAVSITASPTSVARSSLLQDYCDALQEWVDESSPETSQAEAGSRSGLPNLLDDLEEDWAMSIDAIASSPGGPVAFVSSAPPSANSAHVGVEILASPPDECLSGVDGPTMVVGSAVVLWMFCAFTAWLMAKRGLA